MPLNINNIKQASPKANQVATEQYVDTSIAGIDVSGDINANNDVFAQKLGYVDYQAMIAAASTGQTIINGGYVNTSLLQANSIVASKINTVGLIAENISANEISGKTITGGTIIGANLIGTALTVSDVKVKAVNYPNNYGPLTLNSSSSATNNWSAYAYSPIYVSRTYSSGYHSSRMCPLNTTFVLSSSSFIYGGLISSSIEVSVNGGGWSTLISSATLYGAAFSNFSYLCDTSNSVQFRAAGKSNNANFPTITNLSILAENYGQ